MAAETSPVRVEEFLQNVPQKTTSVEKSIDVETDVGNLLISDINELNVTELRKNKEQFLLNFSRENCQILINILGQMPVEKTDEVSVVKLPEPTTPLPREKAVPKSKQPTKWELFARMKDIQKKKKGRMVWDQESQKYKPRWGFKSKDPSKSWLLEVPDKADPMEDQFTKKKKEKKERIAKNELQRLRNIARSTKSKVPGVGLTPTTPTPSKQQLETALAVTHKSTASLGQFMDTLPKEKLKQKKRKFDSNDIGAEEKDRQKKILKKISEARPVVDVNRAANVSQHKEERQRAESKKAGDGQRRKAGSQGRKGGRKFGGKGMRGGGTRGGGTRGGGKKRR